MGMGTTATLAMIYQNKIITAHVGDSRAYMIGDEIKQITKDIKKLGEYAQGRQSVKYYTR